MRFYPGLKPWDLDEMWPGELDELIGHMNAYVREQERAARKAKR